jgi:hypothetical protein
MREALNEIVTDRRFLARRSVTALEVAEHILEQVAARILIHVVLRWPA